MMMLCVYPVSLVMKLWHLLLHNLLRIPEHLSWTLSIVGLVVVIRGLLVPLYVMQQRNGRIGSLLRPAREQITDVYAGRADLEAALGHAALNNRLSQAARYNPLTGCLPLFIQIPAILGLYRMILWMARPREGLNAEHKAIGFISSEDVSAFIHAPIFGVPAPAYPAMTPVQFDALRTTDSEVIRLALPLLALAVLFNLTNLIRSLIRSYRTSDPTLTSSRLSLGIIAAVTLFLPFSLSTMALLGPLPIACVFYWALNSGWTLAQNAILYRYVDRILPITPELDSFIQSRRRLFAVKNLRWRQTMRWKIATLGGIPAHPSQAKARLTAVQELNRRLRSQRRLSRQSLKKVQTERKQTLAQLKKALAEQQKLKNAQLKDNSPGPDPSSDPSAPTL